MTARIAIAARYHEASYGAVELKQAYQKNWFVALGVAIAIHIVLLSTYYLLRVFGPDQEIQRFSPYRPTVDIGPSPYIPGINTPPIGPARALPSKHTIGAPIPVPDTKVDPDQTFPDQGGLRDEGSPIVGGPAGDGLEIPIEIETAPPDFVPGVERDPVTIKSVQAKYPELALRAGIEGKVRVKIWVDKEGKPRQVEVHKSDNEIFNESAIEAARQFLFTPALMNNGPVSVWVSLEFKFRLADQH